MTHLPTVTVVCVTTKDYGPSIEAILKTLKHVDPYDVLYFSDVPYHADSRITHIQIDRFHSVKDYNRFMVKELGKHLESEHVLVIQHDGFVIDGSAWREEFLKYDYVGAPWAYTDGRNVGNGGFSLRSSFLHKVLANDPKIEMFSPEDEVICRFYRQYLEEKHGVKYAPEEVAHQFSYEMHRPKCRTFGFHNSVHPPYREPVVLKRLTGGIGDVIMLEPVMAEFYDQGYRVILDIPPHYFNLFGKHFFPIEHLQNVYGEDMDGWRVINFDMAYEVDPKTPVLETYYKTAKLEVKMRNSRLNFAAPEDKKEIKLFDRYVILHTDDTAMPHRNVHGVDWKAVAEHLRLTMNCPVLRVGKGNGTGGIKINTFSENMLAYIVANADCFIGLDSGVAQIAVACSVPSMIFFGSVNPALRYSDWSKIMVMQKSCPIAKDYCYHSVVSTTGTDCEVDVQQPPCITWSTEEVISRLKEWI